MSGEALRLLANLAGRLRLGLTLSPYQTNLLGKALYEILEALEEGKEPKKNYYKAFMLTMSPEKKSEE